MTFWNGISRRRFAASAFALLLCTWAGAASAQRDPLPSWNESKAKISIVDFVKRVTTRGGRDFVPEAERIAVFDNDGTLWTEQPVFFQFAFALEQAKKMGPRHPEWNDQPILKAALEGDISSVLASGEQGTFQIIAATHSGVTTAEFAKTVIDWTDTATHPRFKRPYTELVFQPMLELLDYLRANGFKTYIVSAVGVEFMRPWTEKIYGIPPEQVIGSSSVNKFQIASGGKPVLVKEAQIEFLNDGPAKPVAINRIIGRRPILAFGNSDGDQEMLEWTAGGDGLRLMGLVHHTDGQREYAYDRTSRIGKLDKAWDEAEQKGWTIVDMKADWRVIYPFDKYRALP